VIAVRDEAVCAVAQAVRRSTAQIVKRLDRVGAFGESARRGAASDTEH
jgi:hypothetical protein